MHFTGERGRALTEEADSCRLYESRPENGRQDDQGERSEEHLDEAFVCQDSIEEIQGLNVGPLLWNGLNRDGLFSISRSSRALFLANRRADLTQPHLIALVRRLGEGEEGKQEDEADQRSRDLIYDSPIVVDGDEAVIISAKTHLEVT